MENDPTVITIPESKQTRSQVNPETDARIIPMRLPGCFVSGIDQHGNMRENAPIDLNLDAFSPEQISRLCHITDALQDDDKIEFANYIWYYVQNTTVEGGDFDEAIADMQDFVANFVTSD